jgi:hypothetical protein
LKKQITLFFFLLVMINAFLSAQSNYFIDQLMDKKQATYGEAAFMALSAAGLVSPDGTVPAAMTFLESSKWGFLKKSEEPATLGDLCYLLMRAFKTSGGVMYSIIPGPRDAVREYEYLGFVRKNPIPTRLVSGEEVVQIVGKVLVDREEAAQ